MHICEPPVIEDYFETDGFTEVTFYPDFERFKMENFNDECLASFAALCKLMACAGKVETRLSCYENFNVSNRVDRFFKDTENATNDESNVDDVVVPTMVNTTTAMEQNQNINNQLLIFKPIRIQDYAGCFFNLKEHKYLTFSDPNGHFDLCLVDTPKNAIKVTTVNGVPCFKGVHINEALKEIMNRIVMLLGDIAKGLNLTTKSITNHVSVFMTFRVNKPVFDTQTKTRLTEPVPKNCHS